MTGRADDLEAARGLQAAIDARVVDERREWSGGAAFLSPSLPQVWDANYLRLDVAGSLDAEAIAAEASELAACAQIVAATIVVEDEASAHELGPSLRGLGFETTRFVLMRLREEPSPPAHEVTDASFDDVRTSRHEMALEAFPGNVTLADQLTELDRRLERAIGGRWFAVRDREVVVARAWLRDEDGVGQVEDVATTPAMRRRGLASAVVSAAARASVDAGDRVTFIVADADATTPELYRKLGFEPMGLTHRFVRQLR